MSVQRVCVSLVFRLCMRMEAIIPVDQTSMAVPIAGVFDDFGSDIAKEPVKEASCSPGE